MGDVSVASVPKVGLPTLIDVSEQTPQASSQPFNSVPNWIPYTVSQPQGNSTSQLGSVLSKQVGITQNRLPNSQGQYVSAASSRDSLSTNANAAGLPSQLLSITPIRIPNAANHSSVSVNNQNLPARSQPTYGPGKVVTSMNQSTSVAPNGNSVIPSQAIHLATPVRRTPPIILRKTHQRSTGLAPNVTNKNLPAGSPPISGADRVLTNFAQSVAQNAISVIPSHAIHLATSNTSNALNCSVYRTPPNTLQNTQQGSTGMASKPIYVSSTSFVNQASFGSSNRISGTGSQAILGTSNLTPSSANRTVRPTQCPVSNREINQGKMINLASNRPLASVIGSLGSLTNRIASTMGQSLSPQKRNMEVQMGSKTTVTSPQSRVSLDLQGRGLSDVNSRPGSLSPVQVELLEPLNQPIHHNRTLTVSYPEEISIPPGSLVELVKVKAVNGAQELQLRIVPQQSVGCSDKNASKAPAAGTAFKVGPPTVGPVGSADKRLSNMETCSKTDSCQAPCTLTSLLKKSYVAATSLNTHNEMGVTVKEEPFEHDDHFFKPSPQQLNKGYLSATNPISKASCLPTAELTRRRKEQSCSSHSLPALLHQNRLPVTSNKQQKTGGYVKESKTSETQLVKDGDCNGALETEGLPVILSVYSLGYSPESDQLPSLVERRPSHGTSANNQHPCASAEDCVDNLFVSRQSSVEETLSQYLQQERDYGIPPATTSSAEDAGNERIRQAQLSRLYRVERHACEPVTQALVNSSQTDAVSGSTDCHSNTTGHKPVEVHPPLLQTQTFSVPPDTEAKERTICGLQISGFRQKSYEQLFTLVPKVSLVRISSKHLQPAVPQRNSEKSTEDIIFTARPVLSCASNKQNISVHQQHCHGVLKLRLKRKRCEAENDSADIFEAFASPLTPLANFEPFGFPEERRKKDRGSGKRRKIRGIVVSHRLYLTPVKEDQPVKCPGPNQPVVVLNHPHPQVLGLGKGPRSPAGVRGIAPLRIILTRDTHKIVPEIVRSPSLKMKFKKVHGNQYQVTELVAEGISDKLVL